MRNITLVGLVLLPVLAATALAGPPAPMPIATMPTEYPPSAPLPALPVASPVVDNPLPVTPHLVDTHTGSGSSSFTGSAEYLLWRLQPGPLPVPVLTTGNPASPTAGALGDAGTQVIFGAGGTGLSGQPTSGVRGMVAYALDPNQCWRLEGGGFWLADHNTNWQVAGDHSGNPPLYVPIFRVDQARESSVIVSDPLGGGLGPFPGSFSMQATSSLYGAECNAVGRLANGQLGSLDLVVGARYLNLSESLQINVNQSAPPLGIQNFLFDRFMTRNQFFGEQTGVRGQIRFGFVTLDIGGSLALGMTHQVVLVAGGTLAQTAPGAPETPGAFPGGIFTAPSNIGRTSHTPITLVPQVQTKVGVRLVDWARAFVGYDLLVWSTTVRPGDQIDRNVNTTQLLGGTLIGPAAPTPKFATSAFYAQGLSLGVELNF
jgi:hypothetical protein